MRLVESDLCVEATQRFALGWSYGGAMSYALACARPTVFRAVAVYSGANLSGCDGGTQPVAYFGIHGIYDSVLNISQGRALRDTFVRNNGCTAQNPREPARGSGTHITTVYSVCRSGYPVQWAAFDGDHTPSPVDGSGQDDSRTWTSGEVWSFFTQFQSTPPTTPPTNQPPGACAAAYKIVGQWQGGFQAEVTVTIGGLTGWRVSWMFANGQAITQIWGGRNAPSGSTQNVSNETWNGNLGAGASTTFGFLGTWNAVNSTPTPTCAQA